MHNNMTSMRLPSRYQGMISKCASSIKIKYVATCNTCSQLRVQVKGTGPLEEAILYQEWTKEIPQSIPADKMKQN